MPAMDHRENQHCEAHHNCSRENQTLSWLYVEYDLKSAKLIRVSRIESQTIEPECPSSDPISNYSQSLLAFRAPTKTKLSTPAVHLYLTQIINSSHAP